MELVYRHRLALGVVALAAVLIGSAAVAWLNLRAFRADAALVSHTQDVLDSTLQTLNALVDAETGERGFLITGAEEFLEPYKLASARVKQQLSRLSSLTADNALQQARLNELTGLAERRLALLERGVALGQAGDAAHARELVRAGARRSWIRRDAPSTISEPRSCGCWRCVRKERCTSIA